MSGQVNESADCPNISHIPPASPGLESLIEQRRVELSHFVSLSVIFVDQKKEKKKHTDWYIELLRNLKVALTFEQSIL